MDFAMEKWRLSRGLRISFHILIINPVTVQKPNLRLTGLLREVIVSVEKWCRLGYFLDTRVDIKKLVWMICLHWILRHGWLDGVMNELITLPDVLKTVGEEDNIKSSYRLAAPIVIYQEWKKGMDGP
jgi:hypothetical protein